jgi:hypothetical protein
MSEPRAPYNVDIHLTRVRNRVTELEASKPATRAAGIEALKRLIAIAQRDTGQSDVVARFLLGCYNGQDFPFDVTELRRLDIEVHDDCMAVLKMDYAPQREVHDLIEQGPQIFKALAHHWAPHIAQTLTNTARRLNQFTKE